MAEENYGKGWGRGSGRRGIRNSAGTEGKYRPLSVCITLTPEEHRIIHQAFDHSGQSISEIGRMLFMQWIASQQNGKERIKDATERTNAQQTNKDTD